MTLNNLGVAREMMEAYEEAAALHERALAIREKSLGPDHAYVASSLGNLAVVRQETGAHEEAHAFNRKEGYQQGYAKGFAAALYGEPGWRRGVDAADNSKKQTFDFAYNSGLRRGYADAQRLSEADKAAARMYIESQMADNNEDYLWGNTDVAGAYVKRAGAWYSRLLP